MRAKEDNEADQLLNETVMLEKIGCFGIVLEKIPATVAEKASKSVRKTILFGEPGRCQAIGYSTNLRDFKKFQVF